MFNQIKMLFNKNRLRIVIPVLIGTLYSCIVLSLVKYTYAILPLILLACLAIIGPKFKGKNELIKDLYLFPLLCIEIVYLFQLITIIDITDDKGIVFLVVLLHDNLVFMTLPLILALYLIVRTFGSQKSLP